MTGPVFPALMVLDGGFGTELERRGCDVRGELWSAEALLGRPDLVEDVHAAYLDAGADCITTGSYQVSFEGFAQRGSIDRRYHQGAEGVDGDRRGCAATYRGHVASPGIHRGVARPLRRDPSQWRGVSRPVRRSSRGARSPSIALGSNTCRTAPSTWSPARRCHPSRKPPRCFARSRPSRTSVRGWPSHAWTDATPGLATRSPRAHAWPARLLRSSRSA